MSMPIDVRTESVLEPVASRDTAISCLVRLGACNGVNLQIETVRRRSALVSDTITVSRLIELADETHRRSIRDSPARGTAAMQEADSLLEGSGFEPPVPL